ncbi:unnamed protein product [Diplocarpon coronariae]|uniref:Uncharacterized protein n=1 Tax=Diplocarpon coronariae TaxID=2795749 RepID=A0A218Z942_9HELO|nr:hypothetical protein B2J93_9562 [Marssonina coronariae]
MAHPLGWGEQSGRLGSPPAVDGPLANAMHAGGLVSSWAGPTSAGGSTCCAGLSRRRPAVLLPRARGARRGCLFGDGDTWVATAPGGLVSPLGPSRGSFWAERLLRPAGAERELMRARFPSCEWTRPEKGLFRPTALAGLDWPYDPGSSLAWSADANGICPAPGLPCHAGRGRSGGKVDSSYVRMDMDDDADPSGNRIFPAPRPSRGELFPDDSSGRRPSGPGSRHNAQSSADPPLLGPSPAEALAARGGSARPGPARPGEATSDASLSAPKRGSSPAGASLHPPHDACPEEAVVPSGGCVDAALLFQPSLPDLPPPHVGHPLSSPPRPLCRCQPKRHSFRRGAAGAGAGSRLSLGTAVDALSSRRGCAPVPCRVPSRVLRSPRYPGLQDQTVRSGPRHLVSSGEGNPPHPFPGRYRSLPTPQGCRLALYPA